MGLCSVVVVRPLAWEVLVPNDPTLFIRVLYGISIATTSRRIETPYHSWERALNEYTNGLTRQYVPKGTDFKTISARKVQRIEDVLNNRPRKILSY